MITLSPKYEFAVVYEEVDVTTTHDRDYLNEDNVLGYNLLFHHARSKGWEIQYVYFQLRQFGDVESHKLGRAIGVLRREIKK